MTKARTRKPDTSLEQDAAVEFLDGLLASLTSTWTHSTDPLIRSQYLALVVNVETARAVIISGADPNDYQEGE
jgi:hypothetical protein